MTHTRYVLSNVFVFLGGTYYVDSKYLQELVAPKPNQSLRRRNVSK